VSLGSLLLGGCAAPTAAPVPATIPGRIVVRPGLTGVVVAAPHGSSDQHTGDIVAALAERTGFASVIASGFVLEPETPGGAGRRYQVNRPFEGVPGRPAAEDVATVEARRVYTTWERRVREASEGPLEFYTEIHGNSRNESADRIEIATVGVDYEQAVRLRTLFELIREAHLRGHAGVPRLAVLVEPADAVRYTASGAKRDGTLRLAERALHIELPRAARLEGRAIYVTILAEFLREAAPLLHAR
jgi:hypothetical protein